MSDLTYRFPIVGSFYREVGTKAIIDSLGVGTPLFLRAEPTNHVDPLAIAVWLRIANIPAFAWTNLEATLPAFGLTPADVRLKSEWQLGYIPKDLAKLWDLKADVPGTFAVGGNGGPRIVAGLDDSLKRVTPLRVADSELLRSQLRASVDEL